MAELWVITKANNNKYVPLIKLQSLPVSNTACKIPHASPNSIVLNPTLISIFWLGFRYADLGCTEKGL